MDLEAQFKAIVENHGAGYVVLIDPDKVTPDQAGEVAKKVEESGADLIFLGGSRVAKKIDDVVLGIKKASALPVVLFPGGASQLSAHLDGVLFLTLVSGRNPRFLIEEQVAAAPFIKKFNLRHIPVAYILVEGNRATAVQIISRTTPLPRGKKNDIVNHALAGKMMGMRAIFMDAGSGAKEPVPNDVITAVKEETGLLVIIGGGVRTPEMAKEKIDAGADFVVTGNIIEQKGPEVAAAFAKAIHKR